MLCSAVRPSVEIQVRPVQGSSEIEDGDETPQGVMSVIGCGVRDDCHLRQTCAVWDEATTALTKLPSANIT